MDEDFGAELFDLNFTQWMESNGQNVDKIAPVDDLFDDNEEIDINHTHQNEELDLNQENHHEEFNLNQKIRNEEVEFFANEETNDSEPGIEVEDVETNDIQADTIVYAPSIGMKFETIEMVDDYWTKYARQTGFSVRIKGEYKSRVDGSLLGKTYLCNREGKKSDDKRRVNSKRRPTARCGCLVKMVVNLNKEKTHFFIKEFIGKHNNHELEGKDSSHLLRSHRAINPLQAATIDVASNSGFGPSATHRYISVEAGGSDRVGFTIQDIKSHLRTKRLRNLHTGEATAVLAYFDKQSSVCPSFFRRLQFDNEGQITNFFWADSKMLVDYQAFGDVLTFDTTFGTNNESRPLGIFTGYNNHRQTVIFGATLLYDETASSFACAFQMFIDCHGGKLPGIIFTDQDHAMKKALKLVMPNVRHGLCCWHLSQNAMKNLSKILGNRWEKFSGELHSCMYGYLDEGMFECKWKNMLETFKLIDNKWLEELYEKRSMWCIAYLKDVFTAGIRSTQLSESVNSRLKNVLKSGMSMERFFEGFDLFLSKVRDKELESDCKSRQTSPHLAAQGSSILRHAADIYTPNMYHLFYIEWDFEHSVLLEPYWEAITTPHIRVAKDGRKLYEVSFDLATMTISCNCCTYEMCGYLCRHILRVLNVYEIREIPEKYIMKRWTKNAKSELSIVETPSPDLSEKQVYNMLCSQFEKVARRGCRKGIPHKELVRCHVKGMHEFIDGFEDVSVTDGANNDQVHGVPSPLEVPVLKKKEIKKSGRKRRFLSCTEKGRKKAKAMPQAAGASGTQPQASQVDDDDDDF